MINKSHYVTIVPKWLADQLAAIGEDIKIVEDFQKMSAIISASEISYYFLMIQKLREYLPDAFDDMILVSEKGNNLRWVADNADVIAKAKYEFDKLFHKAKGNLTKDDVDLIVRRTSYKPKGIADDTLALVGFDSEAEYTYSNFLRDCCAELHKQILFDQYSNMEVFRQYTRHA